MPDGDLTKLPKWAQRRIENLERDLGHWRERALATERNDETDTGIRDYTADFGTPRFLRSGAHVLFGVQRREGPNGYASYDGIECSWRDGHLYVSTANDALLAQPQSSNVLKVRRGDFW